MARSESVRYAFNRGIISPLALARVDLKRSALSSEQMINWMPRRLGSMMLRPGTRYLGAAHLNSNARHIPFIASLEAISLLEFTNQTIRFWIDDVLLTRANVTTAITNGDFNANLVSWNDDDEVGGVSAWVTGGYMGLTGTGTAAAIREQQVTVAGANIGVEHALRIAIKRGPVTLRVGSTSGGDEYITETTLYTGNHSIAFTPTDDFYVRFMSTLARQVLVDSCNVETAGIVSLTTPYASANLDDLRVDEGSQSVDVLFVGCADFTQRRVERRSQRSWSIVLYQPDDGPFMSANTGVVTLTPAALTGNTTLTASRSLFRTTHAPTTNNGGALFRLVSTGQTVTKSMTAANDSTAAIRVTGVGTDRSFTIVLSGLSGTADTVVLQRSFDNSVWVDVSGKSWVADTTESYEDGLDNQIVYYRLRCTVYAAGTVAASLSITTGSITGVCRVTGYTSPTVVDVEVLTDFGATNATDDWSEGRWSDYRGWPTCGTFHEGRLTWEGRDRTQGSVSDTFDSFDPDAVGDSAPWDRTIGSGPLATIAWALSLQRLVLGAQLSEFSVRSNAFDEAISPTNFNCKSCSGQGSANVQAVKIDSRGLFVQRGGTRLFELSFDATIYDYVPKDLALLNPEIGQPSIVRIAVQRQPDTRIHCVRSDGKVAVLVYDPTEELLCWCEMEMVAYDENGMVVASGFVEDVVVLPGGSGDAEDSVYYSVRRLIGGVVVRYLEKWALESECVGGNLNLQADSFVTYQGVATNTLTGYDHLIGQTVIVWGNGKDMGSFVVNASGQITGFTEDLTSAVGGVGYRARNKTAKLGQTLSKHKNVDSIAPVLRNTHAQGLLVGPDFDNLDPLPLMYRGAPVDPDSVYSEYDEQSQEFPGTWDLDARVCMQASAPRPCNVLALTISGQVT